MTIRSRRALPVLAVRGLVERDREWRWEELAALPGRIGDLGKWSKASWARPSR
ncbi:MAG: hypothetical protein M3N51_12305 [Actinomycetota bacterium]|nr:hypothetical protein [Actinomycetota bacterium]